MKIHKKEKAILIKNRPISFIVLEFIEFEVILDVLNNSLPNQYTEIFKYIFNRLKPSINNLNKKELEKQEH